MVSIKEVLVGESENSIFEDFENEVLQGKSSDVNVPSEVNEPGEIDEKPEVDEQTTILSLPEFCLDKILSKLEICDLVKVAGANSHLFNSANRVFCLNFSNREIVYDPYRESSWPENVILGVLSTFGMNVKKLRIQFGCDQEFDKKIHKLLVEKCHLNLIELSVDEIRPYLSLNQTFPKLQKLIYCNSRSYGMNDSWTEFNVRFPNIHSLELKHVDNCLYNKSFVCHLPKLEIFGFYPWSPQSEDFLIIAKFLNTNKQIKNFTLHGHGAMNDLTDGLQMAINWSDLNLRKLHIHAQDTELFLGNIMLLKNLQILTIRGKQYRQDLEMESSAVLPYVELDIKISENDDYINLIKRCPRMTKLKIHDMERSLKVHHYQQLAKSCFQLKEITLFLDRFKASIDFDIGTENDLTNGIIEFIENCKNLTSIEIEYPSRCYSPEFESELQSFNMYFNRKIEFLFKDSWKLNHRLKSLAWECRPDVKHSYYSIMFIKEK